MRRLLERMIPLLAAALGLAGLACDPEADEYPIDGAIFGDADLGDIEARSYVFVATNAPSGNEVRAYLVFEDGTGVERARTATGGDGANLTGDPVDPLGSQDSLICVEGYVFVVNAGTNTISSLVFENRDPDASPRLELLSEQPSRGDGPVSLTYYDENLFVVHRDGTIQGFMVDDGVLAARFDGRASLPEDVVPATIEYRPDGDDLLVTDRAGDRFFLIELSGGVPVEVREHASLGTTPFGAEFFDEDAFVLADANAPGGDPEANGGSVTTYVLDDVDAPKVLTERFPSGQTESERITTLPYLDLFYGSNTASGSVTAYRFDDGRIERAVTTAMPQGSAPLDLTIDWEDEHYVYVLDGGRATIAVYEIDGSQGALIPLNETAVTGLVPGQVYGLDAERTRYLDIDTDF